ncbi:MAG: hypothetical protein IJL30_06955 [Clostridia bacterium]|nr:hypothetical protein [Clostridia bacterium]
MSEREEKAMTVRELSKLYYLNKLIERDTLRLSELHSRLQPGGMNFDGMPRNPSPKNVMEEIIPLIIEIEERIRKEQEDYIKERMEIESFIRSVEDYQIRLILSYRFVDLLTWNQTARMIGGNNTEDSVKKMCYRFLKSTEKGAQK